MSIAKSISLTFLSGGIATLTHGITAENYDNHLEKLQREIIATQAENDNLAHNLDRALTTAAESKAAHEGLAQKYTADFANGNTLLEQLNTTFETNQKAFEAKIAQLEQQKTTQDSSFNTAITEATQMKTELEEKFKAEKAKLEESIKGTSEKISAELAKATEKHKAEMTALINKLDLSGGAFQAQTKSCTDSDYSEVKELCLYKAILQFLKVKTK